MGLDGDGWTSDREVTVHEHESNWADQKKKTPQH